jgi:hypothetical protein
MTLVSQAIFARMCKTTPKTVTKWKQAGNLVMQGLQVDVEATADRMRRYRRRGSPIVLTAEEARSTGTEKGNSRKKGNESGVTSVEGNGGIVTLRCVEIAERVRALDWTQDFEWTPEAELLRARLAAECIGWEVAQSDLRDDGHWGGLQLRIPTRFEPGVSTNAIPAGHGYELEPWEVLEKVREEVETILDVEDTDTIRLDLLPLLARPFHEHDRP